MREEPCEPIPEEPDPAEGEDEVSEDDEDEVLEAYAAGWKAKAKMGDKKKSRGWKPKTSTRRPLLVHWPKRSKPQLALLVDNEDIGRVMHSVPML